MIPPPIKFAPPLPKYVKGSILNLLMFVFVSFTLTYSLTISMIHLLYVCKSLAVLDLTASKVASGNNKLLDADRGMETQISEGGIRLGSA